MDWIDIKTKKPEKGQEVILISEGYTYYAEYKGYKGSEFCVCLGLGIVDPFRYISEKSVSKWVPFPILIS